MTSESYFFAIASTSITTSISWLDVKFNYRDSLHKKNKNRQEELVNSIAAEVIGRDIALLPIICIHFFNSTDYGGVLLISLTIMVTGAIKMTETY